MRNKILLSSLLIFGLSIPISIEYNIIKHDQYSYLPTIIDIKNNIKFIKNKMDVYNKEIKSLESNENNYTLILQSRNLTDKKYCYYNNLLNKTEVLLKMKQIMLNLYKPMLNNYIDHLKRMNQITYKI